MFSINPMYDYTDESAYGKGEAADRAQLYREFEAAGVGVSVMKAFAGGQLLDAAQSPFGRALTREQCIAYALDKPGVACVLPGVRGVDNLRDALSYLDASPERRDYAVIGEFAPPADNGSCVYCNHCQPCPTGIPIGLTNKYYDLARLGDELAADQLCQVFLELFDILAALADDEARLGCPDRDLDTVGSSFDLDLGDARAV